MSGYGGFNRDFIEGHGRSDLAPDSGIDYDSGWREVTATEFADPSDRLAYRLQECKAENNALKDALALTAVELAEVRKERDRAVERLERAGIL